MRIAVLAHSFPRFPGDTHGPFVQRLSESLAELGHEVFALVPFDPELRGHPASPLELRSFRYIKPDRLHLLGYSRTLRRDVGLRLAAYLESPLYFHFAERALRRLIRDEGIELVHAHWILPNGYVAARACRGAGQGGHDVPYVATLHGSDVFMAERNPLFRRLARRALAGAAHVTSCSAELKQRLLLVGGREHAPKVHLVANGTDLCPASLDVGSGSGGAEAARVRHGLGSEGPLLVAVGRLVYKKGFRYLLEAMPEVFESFPAARLALGGRGDLERELREQAARLGIADRVTFTGELSHPRVLELIAAGDLFVMPSIRDPGGNVDGLPIVVLEAMAAGKPLVATDISGLPLAVRHGETGLLVPEQDPAALAGAILRLLGDPREARQMGEAGRRRVAEELNWPAIARIHDRLNRQAVQEAA